jgi:hypothetical protein
MALTKIKPNAVDETLDFSFDDLNANTMSILGTSTFQQVTEKVQLKTAANGTVTHDYSLGTLFYHSSISANFTANITNVPTTNDRSIVVSIILDQGATAYIPNALQIDGASQTINWVGGSTPTPIANKKELVSFVLVRISSSWTVLGSITTFG